MMYLKVVIFSFCVILSLTFFASPIEAQTLIPTEITPTFGCVSGVPCTSPLPTTTGTVSPTIFGTTPGTTPGTTAQPTSSTTAPTVDPCATAPTSVQAWHKKHRKHRANNGNNSNSGFFEQLIQRLIQMLQQLGITIPGFPSTPTPTPSGTPTQNPSPVVPNPTTGVPNPTTGTNPTETTAPTSGTTNPCPSPTNGTQPTVGASSAPSQAASPVPSGAAGSWWQPGPVALEWQWMIGHPLDLNSAADMGTGKTANNGATSPATDPVVYDIDGFDNTAETVSALHAMGKKVVCYIEVGADDGRSDSAALKATGEGNEIDGWPGEHYIDIRKPEVVTIIKARIAMCAQKGFDAIEPDIDESYTANTGFPLTKADEIAYMTGLTNYAHSLGVAMWGKNPDDTGDSYAADMANVFDAVLTEQCNQYGTCDALSAYTGKKPVFNAEYSQSPSQFCAADNARVGWNGAQFDLGLSGTRNPCR